MNRKTRKILHTSDLHLGMNGIKEFDGLASICELAVEQDVNMILIAGDLFDHNRIADEIVEPVASRLQDVGCPVAILPGNHDCLTSGSVFDRTTIWPKYDHIKIFSAVSGENFFWPELGISLWGKSITSEYEDIRPLEGIPKPCTRDCWNIAIAHGFYVEQYPALFPSYHIVEEEILDLTWDYIALGHIPVFRCISQKPAVYYSGSPSFSKTSALVEFSEEKGVLVTCCKF